MYGKCGALDEAREVFDGMCERNVVSWGSMINGYMQNRRERDAVGLFFEMTRAGVWPDGYVFGSVVRACLGVNDFELGRQLHGNVVKSEFGGEVGSQNALVLLYTKFDRMESASVVFDRISKKDVISWGSIIAGFSQQGREVEALELFKEMLSVGIYRPNEFIFGSVFSACSGVLQLDIGRQIHGVSIKFGFGGDAYAGCSVSDMYAKCGSLDYAKIAFYQIENPDLVSWNAIIAAFSYSGVANETTLFFCQMRISGLIPDTISVRCLLSAFTSSSTLCQGQLVHSFVIKMGLDLDVPVSNTLLTMYTKCSDLSTAFKIFEEMRSRVDLVSWNAILTACLHHNQANKVFILLKMMLSSQYEPDHITLTTVLSACSVLASLKMVYQVHNYVVKTGFDTQITVTNSLIDIYTKCGALVNARKIFEFMKNPDVVSWSGLIVGLAQYGDAEEALKHFGKMRSIGVKPNHVTFVGVLTACSRVGLVEEGLDYYKTMEADYGILPTRDHCSCVVDLFARAGRLKEAEVFINQMPLNPDIVVPQDFLNPIVPHSLGFHHQKARLSIAFQG
ncbi:hypothetical protein GIB67_028130 [Kingdonia uniflora]|uniref:Pentatricopeptide repeat-containing protein n=1 Tax=Kingdonia uniflora TaxID=39325 RepID=A0A7J7KZL0_9MAGN|nr:hypothetical protein GIB67_028130 [Kingdonia uniflora]